MCCELRAVCLSWLDSELRRPVVQRWENSRDSLSIHSLPLNSANDTAQQGSYNPPRQYLETSLQRCTLCDPVPKPTSPGSMHVESSAALEPSSSMPFTYLQPQLRPLPEHSRHRALTASANGAAGTSIRGRACQQVRLSVPLFFLHAPRSFGLNASWAPGYPET
jgi:hypothetical protein